MRLGECGALIGPEGESCGVPAWQCTEHGGKPTVPDVLPLVRALYAQHSAGCCWHVVLDDYNVGRETVAMCAETARTSGCGIAECAILAHLLPRMSPTQVRKLARSRRTALAALDRDGGGT